MKIVLSLAEAIAYIREHDALNHLEDAEIVIEGFEEVEQHEEETHKVQKKRGPKKRKAIEPVTQDTVNDIVSEIEAENTLEDHQMSLIDEVLAEEEEEALDAPVGVPLVEQETTPEFLDLDAPLFG